MKGKIRIGERMKYSFEVTSESFPIFDSSVAHEVCSTYYLAKEFEWSSRLQILEVLEDNEEGIGTMIHIDHHSPAINGQRVDIVSEVIAFERNEMTCSVIATVGDQMIAKGKTGQKIVKKEKLIRLFSSLGQ